MTIRVLIADDQSLVRGGIRAVLATQADLEVVGEAADGREAVSLTARRQPDVVLMDVRMPHVDGLEATRRLQADPGTRDVGVLVLTTFDLDQYVFGALRAGAAGFLLKDARPEVLIEAIRAVAGGFGLVAPEVTRRLIREFADRSPRLDSGAIDGLTPRERQVLLLVATGATNGQIAAGLHLSEATVKGHVSVVLDKLGVRNRVQAVIAAYETGLIVPGRDPGAGR